MSVVKNRYGKKKLKKIYKPKNRRLKNDILPDIDEEMGD